MGRMRATSNTISAQAPEEAGGAGGDKGRAGAKGAWRNTVSVEMEPYSTFDCGSVFTVKAERCVKSGSVHVGARDWYVDAGSEQEAKDWVYMLRYVVEEAGARGAVERRKAVVQTREMSLRARRRFLKIKLHLSFLRSFTRKWRLETWGHSRLLVTLYRARGILNPHNLGVPLCFARLSIVALDDADARAAAAGVTSPAMLR